MRLTLTSRRKVQIACLLWALLFTLLSRRASGESPSRSTLLIDFEFESE